MKHPSSREFFAYWDDKRGVAAAPDRSEIEPGAVRELLGDIFVLSCDVATGYPFRVAGTRVCAMLGCDLKGREFTTLFAPGSRDEILDLLGIVATETLAIVAGLTATAADGSTTHFELLLLPFNSRAHSPISLTGLLAPLGGGYGVVSDFSIASWRTIGQKPQRFVPRALRKLSVARGFMVYEGLR